VKPYGDDVLRWDHLKFVYLLFLFLQRHNLRVTRQRLLKADRQRQQMCKHRTSSDHQNEPCFYFHINQLHPCPYLHIYYQSNIISHSISRSYILGSYPISYGKFAIQSMLEGNCRIYFGFVALNLFRNREFVM
jgi:hypothetical protein